MSKMRQYLLAGLAGAFSIACGESAVAPQLDAVVASRSAGLYASGLATVTIVAGTPGTPVNLAADACTSINSLGVLHGKIDGTELTSYGDDAFAGFEYRIHGGANGQSYVDVSAAGLIHDVIVKAGNGYYHYNYPAGVAADEFLHGELAGNGVTPKDISHINFCWTPKPVVELTSETAFARGGVAFGSLGIARWGWSLPLANGTYDLVAGQHTVVGSVVVAGSMVTMTTKPGFFLSETHLYSGSTALPQQCKTVKGVTTCASTVAPGQFGRQTAHDPMVTSVTYTDVNGAYLIAHAVVWGAF